MFTVRSFLIIPGTEKLLTETTVTTSGSPTRYAPLYAEVTDLGTSNLPSGAAYLRVEVTPHDTTTRYWALVTSLSPDSSTLSLATPQ